MFSSPVIGPDSTLYVGSRDNNLYAINGKSAGKLWQFETGGEVWCSPTIGFGGTAYIGSVDKKLYALNGKTGGKLWEFETKGSVSSSRHWADGTLYVGSDDNKLYAIDSKSGVMLWEFETKPVFLPAIGLDGRFTSGHLTKTLCLKWQDRGKLWEFETGGLVTPPAIGTGGTVYVGSYDNKLYAINGKTGASYGNLKRESEWAPHLPST